MADRTGQRLGNYRLVRLLGRGGFAEVYLGEHVRLETQAAIKVLYTQFDGDDAEYFLKEARTVAHLLHPHIVRIFDFDVQDGVPFLVMDYAPNGTLRHRHPRDSRVPLESIISYIKQVADALQYAHDEKLIHRDIKPENMLVGRNNEILISDFGIALIAQSTRMQSTQEVIGTAYYMAPEQLQGKPRIASDQYALGVVVYEWLTGERPFHGSFSEIASQHMFVPPPSMRGKLPSISPSVEEVVMTALAKDPHQRFSTVRAFATALEQASETMYSLPSTILAELPAMLPTLLDAARSEPVVTPHSEPVVVLFSNDAISEPVDFGGPPLVIRASDPINTPTQQNVLEGLVITPPVEAASSPAITPHTKVALQPGKHLYTYRGHTTRVNSVAWSPDGTRIASGGKDRTIKIWDAATGRTVLFFDRHGAEVNAVAWSPDGTCIASGDRNETVWIWKAIANGKIAVCHDSPMGRVNSVAWSPDGTRVASGGKDWTVRVWDTATGRAILFFNLHKAEVNTLAWSPDGTRIASGGADETIQIWEAIANGSAVVSSGDSIGKVNSVAWSPDGTRIVSGHANSGARVWDATTGSKLLVFARHKAAVTAVAWSPDGTCIASADREGYVRIWEPIPDGEVILYKGFSSSVTSLAWSPAGNQIAVARADGTVQVWETA